MRWKFYITVIIRYLLIVLFVYAAVNKLLDHQKFYNDLRNSPIFGNPDISIILSWMVPILELMVAFLLAFSNSRLMGMYAALALMLSFTVYISGILLFSTKLPCSCGGIINNFTWQGHLVFNITITLLTLLAIYLFPKGRKHQ